MYSAKELSPSELYERRNEEQRERLSLTLRDGLSQRVSHLPYMSRLAYEKWHATEEARIEPWFREPSEPDNVVLDLVEILNAPIPDRQAGIDWLATHKDKLTADMLMQLVSETRLVAYSDAMRANNRGKSAKASQALRDIGWRWLEYQAGRVDGKKHSKNSAAPLIAKEFNLSQRRVREHYLIGIEENSHVFPDGVAVARKELGLIE